MFDLLIQNGTLIDGTGAAPRAADVAVAGDRIAAIGPLAAHAGSAARTIDARGLVVAPGFIDVHNHSDGWLVKLPQLVPKTSQGFTTEVLASDGISYAPVTEHNWREWFHYLRALNALEESDYGGWRTLGEFLAHLDGRSAQNAAMLVPYANLRVLAAGWGRGPLDDAQLKMIRREIDLAMQAGACGLSTGLDYIAQCFSTTDELVDACRALAPWGKPYVTHVRYKLGTLAGVQEAVDIGRRAGVPVHVSHLKPTSAEEGDRILSYVDRSAVHQVDFTFDIYPYLAGSTMLHYLLPYEVWQDGPLAAIDKLADPQVRARAERMIACYDLPPDRVTLAWCASAANRRHVGRTLAEYAADQNKSVGQALCDLVVAERLAALCVLRVGDDALVRPFLAHPKCMLGSDGIYFPDGQVHPRVSGSATRMLGPLVRECKLFSLAAAVYKMTGLPAARFGLQDRGVLREGAFADIVVFDPATVADRATYDNPHERSVGIQRVLVNGVEIFGDGRPLVDLGPRPPGRALRRGC
ncbi:MAG: amidohydrolase family protein [Pirellulales bacterium]